MPRGIGGSHATDYFHDNSLILWCANSIDKHNMHLADVQKKMSGIFVKIAKA
jgi:hypothetical protein